MRKLMKYMMVAFGICAFGSAMDKTEKIIIVKADDVRGNTDNWNRFFKVSNEKNVKVSAGIICNSLPKAKKGYLTWLKELNASGQVEFWNHGWDHKRWTDDCGNKLSEFNGSGYDHQKKHFSDAQKSMERVFGAAPIAFGTPFNALDDDTLKVMDEDEDLRLFFCYRSVKSQKIVSAKMAIRGEHDGTGKPNFNKFKKDYEAKEGLTFAAIQFHPNPWKDEHFVEYEKILDLLLADGWTFMLPSEYVVLERN